MNENPAAWTGSYPEGDRAKPGVNLSGVICNQYWVQRNLLRALPGSYTERELADRYRL